MYMNYLIGSFYLGYYFKVEFQVSIFVGNLPFRAEREDILELFTPYGEVMNCSLPLERDTGRKRGFAFVEMADEALETSAIDGLQGTELMGRPLIINKAEPRGGGGGPLLSRAARATPLPATPLPRQAAALPATAAVAWRLIFTQMSWGLRRPGPASYSFHPR